MSYREITEDDKDGRVVKLALHVIHESEAGEPPLMMISESKLAVWNKDNQIWVYPNGKPVAEDVIGIIDEE